MGKIEIQRPQNHNQRYGAHGRSRRKEAVVAFLNGCDVIQRTHQKIERGKHEYPLDSMHQEKITTNGGAQSVMYEIKQDG